MSYLDYLLRNNILKTGDEGSITGRCDTMCPQEEIDMREKYRLVHILEKWGPVMRKYVKSFSRSAADNKMAQPHLLRPYPILKDTIQHLLLDVTRRHDVPLYVVYDFIDDRLRAVRQDMTIQRLPADQCASLLEPMIRFYIWYGHRLCEYPLKDYDPVLNKKYSLECLKWFLTCCKSVQELDDLSIMLNSITLDYKLKCDRVLMESLYILSNLDDLSPLFRYLTLPKHIKRHPKLLLAYNIAVANLKGNYVAVCRLMETLCPLTYCAVCVYLPQLQRRALQTMSHAYSSKQLTVPALALVQMLNFSRNDEVLSACAHYGLTTKGDSIRFSKGDFKLDEPTLQPKKHLFLEKKHIFTVDHIFTYVTE